MMTGKTLEGYYNDIHMIVVVHKMFSLTEVEKMIPFELEMYKMFDKVYNEKVADEIRTQQSIEGKRVHG